MIVLQDRVAPAQRLRIAVLGDFEGTHTRSWLRWFVARGHDVHGISYYQPSSPPDGVTMHVLRPKSPSSASVERPAGSTLPLPRSAMRIVHAMRYRRAGLARVVAAIAPDVLHAHFVVEHGFYGALAGFHPYVVTAWGSDVLVEPQRDPLSGMIARWTLRRADLVTSNNAYMADRIAKLGVPRTKIEVITLGAERYDLEHANASVNRRAPNVSRTAIILSTRAHEPLYNIDEIIDAYARLGEREQRGEKRTEARLLIAHSGSMTDELRMRAARNSVQIGFTGTLDRAAFRDVLAEAELFVSVPSSDGTSVALLQAMAAGAFPIVSDLPSQHELITDGVNGLLVPPHDPAALAAALRRALDDRALRRRAADLNRAIVEERGLNETQMARMEGLYSKLADEAKRKLDAGS